MPSGRKPTPTKLKILHGNPGKRPLPLDEPSPPVGLPQPPAHLNALALAEWQRLGPILADLGIVTQVDTAVLAGYCVAYARWAMAEMALQQSDDLLVEGMMGGKVQNPLVHIANKALELMHKYMVEMGLTPSSRTRIKSQKPQEVDALEAFLGAKKTKKV